MRTCNDHILVVLADHEGEDAKLNIEGTTHILFVMPRKARTHGLVDAYFLPTAVVADAARTTHRQWLQTQPGSNGNRTWNLWFSDKKSPKAENYSGFARKWAAYRLPGEFGTDGVLVTSPNVPLAPASSLKLGDVIAAAKRQIADVAGVSPEAVRISVDLA